MQTFIQQKPYLFLLLCCLVLYVPGQVSLPVVDRDEARYAQATKQMLESGNFLDIRFQEEPRYKKPIGIYWLQSATAGAAQVLGAPKTKIWPYRLGSLLAAIGAVLTMFGLWRPLIGQNASLIAAGAMASSLLLVVEAHLAKTDAVQLCCSVLVLGSWASLLEQRGQQQASLRYVLIFWLALALAMLVKGPVLPGILVLTVLAGKLLKLRWWGDSGVLQCLKPQLGVPLVLLLIGPWFWWMANHAGQTFVQESLVHDFWLKLRTAQESHGAPPFTYTLLAPLILFPGSLIIMRGGWQAWQQRKSYPVATMQPVTKLLLAWLAPAWLLLEFTPTKLPHYILPLVPVLCLLAARQFKQLSTRFTALIMALAITWPILIGGVLPRIPDVQLSNQLQTYWQQQGKPPLALIGYHEPSAVFLTNTSTLLAQPSNALELLRKNPAAMVAVTADKEDVWQLALKDSELRPQKLPDDIEGFNYSKGKWLTLHFYRLVEQE